MTPEWLIRRFADPRYSPRQYQGSVETYRSHRGDHNLNEDMQPQLAADGRLRAAAVLVPIINRPQELTVLFTRRTAHLSNHAGQISFPGGGAEQEDLNAEHTALRECEEEVGLAPRHIRTLGRLDDYVTRTGFIVTPVVGLVEPPFPLRPDPYEVAEVFEVPLSFLLDSDNHARHDWLFEGKLRRFYAMPYQDYFIWGATAGMLINLYQFLMPGEAESVGS